MVDISIVSGIINQLITGGAPPCRVFLMAQFLPGPASHWAGPQCHALGLFRWSVARLAEPHLGDAMGRSVLDGETNGNLGKP